jgi:hypothetical protein
MMHRQQNNQRENNIKIELNERVCYRVGWIQPVCDVMINFVAKNEAKPLTVLAPMG